MSFNEICSALFNYKNRIFSNILYYHLLSTVDQQFDFILRATGFQSLEFKGTVMQ